jgi:tetraacyldisaccharide 4'-kinase
MAAALQHAWLRRGVLACILWPASLVFGCVAALRRLGYRAGVFQSDAVPATVVVVGNVIAGGSGKTPVVIALLDHLHERGIAAGAISRGWGRAQNDCREVRSHSDARDVGDEPLLIATTSQAPVFVAPRRIDAARALLAAYPRTQVIVCDDGLQHYGLKRDLEICAFDERGVGNGWLLPAGPLREPWPRAVDLVLRAPATPAAIDGFTMTRQLAGFAQRADGARIDLANLRDRPFHAVAGIAKPEAFFAMLREQGLQLAHTTALPDHHDFTADIAPGDEVICTSKDAVKLWRVRPDAWAAPLSIDIEPAFWTRFDSLLDAKLSSRHGSQTS